MEFEKILVSAKANDIDAKSKLFELYRPLLIKNALIDSRLDEDLYQELQLVLEKVIKSFKI